MNYIVRYNAPNPVDDYELTIKAGDPFAAIAEARSLPGAPEGGRWTATDLTPREAGSCPL